MNQTLHPSIEIAGHLVTFSTSDKAFMRAIKKECILHESKRSALHIDADTFFSRIKPEVPPLLKKNNLTKAHYMIFLFSALIEQKLISKGVMFMHGCSFERGGRAYLCIGPSGAGKTTVVSHITPVHRLSNDTSIIEKKGRDYYVWRSPFDKLYYRKNQDEKKVKLACISILKQAAVLKAKQMAPEKKMYHLLRNDLSVMNLFTFHALGPDEKKTQKKAATLYLELLKRIPVFQLFFLKDSHVDEYLERVMESEDIWL